MKTNKKTTKKATVRKLDHKLYTAWLETRIREAVSRHVGSNLTEAITKDVLAAVQK